MIRIVSFAFFILVSCSDDKSDHVTISGELEKLIIESQNSSSLNEIKNKLSKAVELNEKLPDDTIKSGYYRMIACEYYNSGMWEPYYNQTLQNIYFSKKINDTTMLSKLYYDLGDYFLNKNVNDSSYFYYNKAINTISGNSQEKLRSKFNIAKLLFFENQLIESEVHLIKTIALAKENNDKRLLYECYSILGGVQSGLRNFDDALRSYKISSDYLESIKSDNQFDILQSENFNNIGNVYLKMNENQKAIDYYQMGLNALKKNKFPKLYAILIDNINYASFKNGTLSTPDGLFKALKIRDSLKHTHGLIMSHQRIGEYFLNKGDTVNSSHHLDKAHTLATNTRSFRDQLTILKLKSLVEPKKASEYSNAYIKLSDSLLFEERQTRNKFAKIEYETEQIKLEKNVLVRKINHIMLISFFILLFLGTLYWIYRQKVQYKVLLLEKDQQKSNEEVYNLMLTQQQHIDQARAFEKKRIATELHDGIISQLFGIRMHLEKILFLDIEIDVSKAENYLNKLNLLEHQIRNISHKLSDDELSEKQSFILLIQTLLEDFEEDFQINTKMYIDKNIKWEILNNEQKINIFRIIQEALTNIRKYASAENVEVHFNLIGNWFKFIVKDDGIGIKKSKNKGIGLKNMEFRLNNLKGKLKISSSGLGTEIEGVFPLK